MDSSRKAQGREASTALLSLPDDLLARCLAPLTQEER